MKNMEKAGRARAPRGPWPLVRLGDVCEFRRGLTYSKSDEVDSSSNVVLRSNNVDLESSKLVLSDLKHISDAIKIPADKKVAAGSILMCMANGSKCHLGKVAIIEENLGYAFGGFMGLLVPTEDILTKYLFSILISPRFKSLINNLMDGANINNLKFKDIERFQFPLPPLAVQREIVARLEKELGTADRMAAEFRRLAERADELFKSELDAAFREISHGDTEARREEFTQRRRGAEGDGLIEARAESGRVRAPRGPVRRVKLGDVCENLDSRRVPITKCNRKEGIYPYYGASGIVDYVDSYIFDGDYLLVSEDGANLVARATPIAFPVSGKIWVNNHAHILSFDHKETQSFVEYYFASIDISSIVLGAAQPKLTQKALNDVEMPFPPLSIQREIVARLDAVREKSEKLKAAAERGVALAVELRKAVLVEAFQ